MANPPITAVIVGAGHRSVIYANYSLTHPDELKIVGVADPDPERRAMCREYYGIPEERCFESAQALAAVPKFADAVINGTMDRQHFSTAVPLLEKGYHMLLEKPFAVSEDEMRALMDVVSRTKRRVMICHVLRYAPFYLAIKERIDSGELGDVLNVQMAEHVSYHHLSTSYVRGKWANEEKSGTSMLLAKSCHDVDVMMWLMAPDKALGVASVGSRFQFRPENAPENAGTRCTVDCPLVNDCRYSSKLLYLDHPNRWTCYAWADLEHNKDQTEADRIASFQNGNPYNRCIYKCDNTVVDHQSLLVNFRSGATGTFNMIGGAAKSQRKIHVTGTLGEIEGVFEDNRFTVTYIDAPAESGCREEVVDLSAAGEEGHGGGDDNLVADFVRYLRTGEQSISCTAIENSVPGHLTVFKADESRLNGGQWIPLDL